MNKLILLLITSLLIAACLPLSVPNDDYITISRDEYNRNMAGAYVAGLYSFCYASFPGPGCRNEFDSEFTPDKLTRTERISEIQPFIDSLYDDKPGLDYTSVEAVVASLKAKE